eukprot:COSAG05_NODE_17276_length_328_cov_0.903930_1_plen_59_part_00
MLLASSDRNGGVFDRHRLIPLKSIECCAGCGRFAQLLSDSAPAIRTAVLAIDTAVVPS